MALWIERLLQCTLFAICLSESLSICNAPIRAQSTASNNAFLHIFSAFKKINITDFVRES